MEKPEGVRERKRRETLARIADTGLKLFLENGYEATTLDAIAEASGISRRTFFYYFKSKEDVLLARQDAGFELALRSAILACAPDQRPFAAVRECLLLTASQYENEQSSLVDRLMTSTEALRTRKDARFVEMERRLVDALAEVWSSPEVRSELEMVAMSAMGTLRMALAEWRRDNAERRLTHYLEQSFALLARAMSA